MRTAFSLTCLIFCFACTATHEPVKSGDSSAPRGTVVVDTSRPKLPLEELRPAEIPAAVEATFRLMPDRRVLNAIADISELQTGNKDSHVQIDFRGGAWQIRYAGQDVGALPELATFEQDLNLLIQWSGRLRRPAGAPIRSDVLQAIDREIEGFTPPKLFGATYLLALHTGGALDAAAAARAERATTLLASQIYDWFDLGDPLRARALALLAIAKQADPQCCAEDVALQAKLLGYDKEAESLAHALPATSYAASFILGIPPGAKVSSPAFDWLRAREELRKDTLSDPNNIFRGTLDVQFAPLLMRVSGFGDKVPIARAEESLILRELETRRFNRGTLSFHGDDWMRSNPTLNFEEKAPLQRFNRALPDRIKTLQNRILDADAVRSDYESNFFAAVFTEFDFNFYQSADRGDTKAFIAALGKPSTDISTQVVTWMKAMIDAHFDAAHATRRPADVLGSLPLAGIFRRSDLLQELGRAIGPNQSPIRRAASQFYQQLDSRPAAIDVAGQISMIIIDDPERRDRYLPMVIDRAPDTLSWGDIADYRLTTGDRASLRDLVEHASNTMERSSALGDLATLGSDDQKFVHRKFEEILANTTNIPALSAYATYLNDRNEPAIKERFMRRWFDQQAGRADPITEAWVASSLADALERQRKYEEAWQVIEPHIPVYSENVLTGAASVLQRLGRTDEANQMDAAAVDRYHNTEARTAFAQILWREGKFAEAAALFDPKKVNNPDANLWWNLPDAFVETFKNAGARSAVAAYAALMAVGVDYQVLDFFSEKALDQHRPKLAFALAERLVSDPSRAPAPNRPESITALLAGYRALKELKGTDTALAWLQQRLPSTAAMQALIVFYQQAEYDLVQRFASAVSEKTKSPEVAALEAASLLMMRVPQTDIRWQKLDQRIRALPNTPNSLPMAKYLAGLVDEKTFLASATKRPDYSDAEYFAGVRAMANGDYERALSMFIGCSFGFQDYPPPAWALAQLYRWENNHAAWESTKLNHIDSPNLH